MLPQSRSACKLTLLICTLLTLSLFPSCVDRIKSDLIGYEALDEGLMTSNGVIDRSNTMILSQLENKMMDPRTSEKAKVWYPRAQQVEAVSKNIFAYIEDLKTALKRETGDGKESFKKNDKNSVMRIFSKQEHGGKLYERLKAYRSDILGVDPEISREFSQTILLTTSAFDTVNGKQEFTKTFFDDIPAVAAVAMLSKLQNNIKVNENRMVIFCDNKVAYFDDRFLTYTAFAGISANIVKPGQKVEITSGVGAFSKAVMPVISINGKNASIESDGAVHYVFTADAVPGKHIVPIEINFIDEAGKKQTIVKDLEYTVSDCK